MLPVFGMRMAAHIMTTRRSVRGNSHALHSMFRSCCRTISGMVSTELYTFLFQPHSCSEAALGLLTCMEETECVKKDGKGIMECLKDPVESDDCRAYRNAYTSCKHSQLNMRTRIRGVRTY